MLIWKKLDDFGFPGLELSHEGHLKEMVRGKIFKKRPSMFLAKRNMYINIIQLLPKVFPEIKNILYKIDWNDNNEEEIYKEYVFKPEFLSPMMIKDKTLQLFVLKHWNKYITDNSEEWNAAGVGAKFFQTWRETYWKQYPKHFEALKKELGIPKDIKGLPE